MEQIYRDEHEWVILSRENTRIASVSSSNNPGEQFERDRAGYVDSETASLALDGRRDEAEDHTNTIP